MSRVIPIAPASSVGTSLYAKHEKVYPRAVQGRFARWRVAMVLLTQALFFGLPWLPWSGRPAVLFDLEARRFFVFDLVLYPQDLIYLAALLVIAALALFFFTAVAGRLWCGYACPQTVYTELFLWIEQRTEGDRLARQRLDAAPWSAAKLARKGAKHAGWAALSLATGFSFVAYFVPAGTLARELATFTAGGWAVFWVLFYGAATYGNAGFMREQVCKYMCPYARFQSALIDRDSLVIAYDRARGEPRGARSRKAEPALLGLGSCVDCTLCLQVCPTGIDIRNGLQNECIGCAACIDACDGVMGKMGYAKGLIRYATENGVEGGWNRARMLRRALRPRTLVYGAVLLAVTVAFAASLALRSPFRVDVIRDRSTLARIVDDGRVENVYRLQVLNASETPQTFRVSAHGLPGLVLASAPTFTVEGAGIGSLHVRLQLPPEAAAPHAGQSNPVVFDVEQLQPGGAPGPQAHERSTFVVPR